MLEREFPWQATHFIDGHPSGFNDDGPEIPRYNPADNRQFISLRAPEHPSFTIHAIFAADHAFREWAAKTPMDRSRILARFLELARSRVDDIALLMMREAGKPAHEAYGEANKGFQILEHALGIAHRLGGITRAGEGGVTNLRTHLRPLGPVALITPWNFPWAVPLWKLAPALIAGNTVVFKGSEWTPMMNTFIGALLLEAGVPPGVFNVIQGAKQTVESIVQHPLIQAVSFTGGTSTWRSIHAYMAANRENIIPCQAELGGNNAVLVTKSAHLDLAADGIIAGKFGSAGQRCTATQRVVVDQAVYSDLMRRIQIRAGEIDLGVSDSIDRKTMGPLVNEQQLVRVINLCSRAQEMGAELVFGGHKAMEGDLKFGNFMRPTAYIVRDSHNPLWLEEVFGPVLVVSMTHSFEEGLRAVNDSTFGLSASIYSEDRRELQAFEAGAEVGMVHLNEPTAGGEPQVGFGGWKDTGVGPREMGDEGIGFFTRSQTIFDSSAGTGGKLAAR